MIKIIKIFRINQYVKFYIHNQVHNNFIFPLFHLINFWNIKGTMHELYQVMLSPYEQLC